MNADELKALARKEVARWNGNGSLEGADEAVELKYQHGYELYELGFRKALQLMRQSQSAYDMGKLISVTRKGKVPKVRKPRQN